MEALNTAIPPNNTNPLAPQSNATAEQAAAEHARQEQHSHATTGAHTVGNNSKMEGIKATLHDIKENVKETLQRDHHHGQDCAKKPQDGKTNPME